MMYKAVYINESLNSLLKIKDAAPLLPYTRLSHTFSSVRNAL